MTHLIDLTGLETSHDLGDLLPTRSRSPPDVSEPIRARVAPETSEFLTLDSISTSDDESDVLKTGYDPPKQLSKIFHGMDHKKIPFMTEKLYNGIALTQS